jgi:hypothetical protein
MFYVQIVIDLLLCGLMLYFLWRLGRARQPKAEGMTGERLEALIAESQEAANRFVEALSEGRRALKELSYLLEEKEARLQALLRQADSLVASAQVGKEATDHSQVLRLADAGLPAAEIAAQTGLTEGEVTLIIDLARSRDKTR